MENMRKIVVLTALLFASSALAFDVGTLANGHENDDFISFAILLMLVMLALGGWSMMSRGSWMRSATRKVDNLYLGCSLKSKDGKYLQAHLRSVGLGQAKIVSKDFLGKGDVVRLKLSSLPGFPSEQVYVDATVLASEVVRGNPPSYILSLGWKSLPPKTEKDLSSYISHLSGSGFSPA